MKIIQYIFVLSTILPFTSCQKEDIKLVSGCCDSKPSFEDFGNANIFIPNIFTPNGDGVHDWFYVSGDSINRIVNFEVRVGIDHLVFQVKNVDLNEPTVGWDGKVNGTVVKGLYSYYITIETEDGTIGNIEGKVCNFPCVNSEEDRLPLENCHYPSEWLCRNAPYKCFLSEGFPECIE